ncbi:MAG: hypothetical protein PHY31_08820, partial [Smithellaceae bacterium]|nr:hypothetical protein [Smithellaceae bacterium]
MYRGKHRFLSILTVGLILLLMAPMAFAGEADIKLPDLSAVAFNVYGYLLGGIDILNIGLVICAIGMIFGL